MVSGGGRTQGSGALTRALEETISSPRTHHAREGNLMFWTLLVLCLLAAIPLVILGVRRRARRGARLNDLRPATSNPLPDGGLQRATAALCIPT